MPTSLKEVQINLPEELREEATPDREVPTLSENVTFMSAPTPDAEAVVAAMNERVLMMEGYSEMADEMLAIARETRAAQIRSLPEE